MVTAETSSTAAARRLRTGFFAITRGNNTSLAISELKSVVESATTAGLGGKVMDESLDGGGRIVTFKTDVSEELVERLRKLALTRCVAFHEATGKTIRELSEKLVFPEEGNFSFAVRMPAKSTIASHLVEEAALGEMIFRKCAGRVKVDLGGDPDLEIILAVMRGAKKDERIMIAGKRLVECDTSWRTRRLRIRPFFHPSMMQAGLARTLCNLAGVKAECKTLDPFCGGGSILLEAGLMGARISGIDNAERMVEGCKKNLESFGLDASGIERGDAMRIGDTFGVRKQKFDCIVTDPPYGRGSSTGGVEVNELYRKAFESMHDSLIQDGGMLAACLPSEEAVELVKSAGFSLKSYNTIRVHKNLTRRVCGFAKN